MSFAGATLIVGVALVIAAVAARVLVWTLPDDDVWARGAREHLEPLGTWALGLLGLHALALLLGGSAGFGAWALLIVLVAAALWLRGSAGDQDEEPRWTEATVPLTPPPPTGRPVAGVAPPRHSLWSEPATEDLSARSGLWSQ